MSRSTPWNVFEAWRFWWNLILQHFVPVKMKVKVHFGEPPNPPDKCPQCFLPFVEVMVKQPIKNDSPNSPSPSPAWSDPATSDIIFQKILSPLVSPTPRKYWCRPSSWKSVKNSSVFFKLPSSKCRFSQVLSTVDSQVSSTESQVSSLTGCLGCDRHPLGPWTMPKSGVVAVEWVETRWGKITNPHEFIDNHPWKRSIHNTYIYIYIHVLVCRLHCSVPGECQLLQLSCNPTYCVTITTARERPSKMKFKNGISIFKINISVNSFLSHQILQHWSRTFLPISVSF